MNLADYLTVNNRNYTSRLLHCFGTKNVNLTLDLAVNLIKESGTQFIAFYTHNIDNITKWEDLPLGFSTITLSQIEKEIELSKYTLLNNINHATSCSQAIERARKAAKISESNIIKLEVLTPDLKESNDDEVVKAAQTLKDEGFEVVCLLSCNLETAKTLEEIGCSMLRMMGSPIGSHKGFEDEETSLKIFNEIKIPVILEGGIGTPQHVVDAMRLGADGALVNASLFSGGDPINVAKTMKNAVISGRADYLKLQNNQQT